MPKTSRRARARSRAERRREKRKYQAMQYPRPSVSRQIPSAQDTAIPSRVHPSPSLPIHVLPELKRIGIIAVALLVLLIVLSIVL